MFTYTDNLKNMKTTSNMKMTSNMNITSNMETTSNIKTMKNIDKANLPHQIFQANEPKVSKQLSLSFPELGPAQPRLVILIVSNQLQLSLT